MTRRPKYDFSQATYFKKLMAWTRRELEFTGKTFSDWRNWRQRFYSKLVELVGDYPPATGLRARVVERKDCGEYLREMVVYWSTRGSPVPAWVLVPKKKPKRGKHRAILCLHGHGPGMDHVAGVHYGDPAKKQEIRSLNYDYGLQFARRGFLTMTPEARSFGRRGDRESMLKTFRDLCNVNHLKATLLGYNLIALDLWDLKCALNYLETRPDVDSSRIGSCGLSYGGTMSMYLSALDERIKASVISCYATTFRSYAVENDNFCGSQYVPGIARYGDIGEIIGLIAPRPVCIENGLRDIGFKIDQARLAHEKVRRIYRASGVLERLVVDEFDGLHAFSGRKSIPFMEKWL